MHVVCASELEPIAQSVDQALFPANNHSYVGRILAFGEISPPPKTDIVQLPVPCDPADVMDPSDRRPSKSSVKCKGSETLYEKKIMFSYHDPGLDLNCASHQLLLSSIWRSLQTKSSFNFKTPVSVFSTNPSTSFTNAVNKFQFCLQYTFNVLIQTSGVHPLLLASTVSTFCTSSGNRQERLTIILFSSLTYVPLKGPFFLSLFTDTSGGVKW